MTRTKRIQKLLSGLWTAQDIRDLYRVSTMTVHLWRDQGLPAVVLEGTKRPAVRFVPRDVRSWVRMHRELHDEGLAA